MNLAAHIAIKSTAIFIKAVENTKKQNNERALLHMQKLSKINQKTKSKKENKKEQVRLKHKSRKISKVY